MNSKLNQSNQCDPNNTLVELFFNLIFKEFYHTPPVCVCVQMCMGRPTYCYPNSCLKRPTIVKEDTTTTAHSVNQIHYDSRNQAKSVMFLVESDLIDNIFEAPTIKSHSGWILRNFTINFIWRHFVLNYIIICIRKMSFVQSYLSKKRCKLRT